MLIEMSQELFKDKYRVKSIRLKDFNYASNGAYYVTICTKDRKHYFGEIVNGEMKLSGIGVITKQCWSEIPQHFNNVRLDEFVIMPNHVHGIIIIDTNNNDITNHCRRDVACNVSTIMYNISPKSKSLSTTIRSFKSAVSNRCNKNGYHHFTWQPRFYEHVVRNEKELYFIRNYIKNNPWQWEFDNENKII